MAYNTLSRKNFLELADNSFRKHCSAAVREDEQHRRREELTDVLQADDARRVPADV